MYVSHCAIVGALVGAATVGAAVGAEVGAAVGAEVGIVVGTLVGAGVGATEQLCSVMFAKMISQCSLTTSRFSKRVPSTEPT